MGEGVTFDPKQVEEIHEVRYGMFSVARHFGGCTIMGVHYVYDPNRDVLIRADVHKRRQKEARKKRPDPEDTHAEP